MNIILNPPREDLQKYGSLAYVPQGERLKALDTMTAKGLRRYCEEIEKLVDKKRRSQW